MAQAGFAGRWGIHPPERISQEVELPFRDLADLGASPRSPSASPGPAIEGTLDHRAEIRFGHAGVLAGPERRGAQLRDAGPHRLDHLAGHTGPHRHNVDRSLEGVEVGGAAVGQRHVDGVLRARRYLAASAL